MLKIDSMPGCVPGLPSQVMDADDLLPPRLARMRLSFGRLAARAATEQGVPAVPNVYAVWGRLSDGSVLGLQLYDGTWQLTRVPLPPAAARLLKLPDVLAARNQLLWIEFAYHRIDLFQGGNWVPLWRAEQPAVRTPSELGLPNLN